MAVRCPQCACPHCPSNGAQERKIRFRGRVRVVQRRWRVCRHCGFGFWTREFVEDKENSATEPTSINPLFTQEFLSEAPDNPYVQGSET